MSKLIPLIEDGLINRCVRENRLVKASFIIGAHYQLITNKIRPKNLSVHEVLLLSMENPIQKLYTYGPDGATFVTDYTSMRFEVVKGKRKGKVVTHYVTARSLTPVADLESWWELRYLS